MAIADPPKLRQYAKELEEIQNARDTQGIAPPFTVGVTVVQDLFLVGTTSAPDDLATIQQALGEARVLGPRDYLDSSTRRCGGFGFADTYFQPVWIMAQTTSATAGGCNASRPRAARPFKTAARPPQPSPRKAN